MLTIAIAGLGTVGAATLRLLQQNGDLMALRAGQPIAVKAVSARDKHKKRECSLDGITWVDDPRRLAELPDIDVVVELIGGAEGAARDLAEGALKKGKHFVTANKALLATHGKALAAIALEHNVQIFFEAAVAGGIPVIKTLREGLAGNRISVVRGILNGTCNYILTRMREAQLSFADALKEAQTLGYAEADPTSDIDGHDTANKLALLAALAFDREPDLTSIKPEGIRRLTLLDHQFAEELDCRIKLLGVARLGAQGVEQRVSPCLVPKTQSLAQADGPLNAVLLRGDFVGDLTLEGRGAGAAPTASAVVADLMDLARGSFFKGPLFHASDARRAAFPSGQNQASLSRYYVRLQVMDKPGVVADISAILRDELISIESLIQRGKSATGAVPVVITTHGADEKAIQRAAAKIARVGTVVEPPCFMQIED